MRNFVIINGVNSNTINGLGINELPPITKPEMRNIREEIDGRDGDITTNLGYSAYDKTITIGLFGTGYDINNIVAFFNGEGTIVFSNEPDKYYNFKILNQIDYESLQKFKTASITFHCQPFKYPLSETPLEIEYDYIEDEGETLTLNNTGNALMELNLKGNTSQSGTPTPTSPIPVSVVSGDNDVVVCGKNLAIKNVKGYFNTGATTIAVDGDSESFVFYAVAGQTYTFSSLENMNRRVVAKVDTLDIVNNTPISNSRGFTGDTITSEFTGYCIVYVNSSLNDNIKNSFMLNVGSTALPYEPYQSQTYEVDLGTLELCKIGTYQDYFTKNSDGQWCKYNAIGKVVLDGSEDGWTSSHMTNTYGYFKTYHSIKPNTNNSSLTGDLTNYFKEITPNQSWNGDTSLKGFCITTDQNIRFNLGDATNELNSFKTWLSTHNTNVYYILNTPYLSLIEDNNLIEQLDNLSNAMSYEGTTNINQVNNDKAFIISAKALEQGSNEVVVNNIGNVYSKPLIALEGSGNVDIYLDNTQILKANVEDKMNIDIAQLEAYNPDTSALLNRQVIGNYNSMTFQPGNNKLTINGSLSKATITNYTRYL